MMVYTSEKLLSTVQVKLDAKGTEARMKVIEALARQEIGDKIKQTGSSPQIVSVFQNWIKRSDGYKFFLIVCTDPTSEDDQKSFVEWCRRFLITEVSKGGK